MEVATSIEKKARNFAIKILEELTNCFSEEDIDYVTNMIIEFVEEI